MTDLPETPEGVRHILFTNNLELRKAPAVYEKQMQRINELEDALGLAKAVWQDAWDAAYSTSEGSVEDRKIAARAAARDHHDTVLELEADLRVAKAEAERIELKRKQWDREQMALQSALKSMLFEGA